MPERPECDVLQKERYINLTLSQRVRWATHFYSELK